MTHPGNGLPLDLHRHAILEASAGTGKTYSIGELVLRLLKEEAVPLDNILIVTFTEKATGELKARLRSSIEKELAESPHHRVLQKALDEFDQAWIFTLHGFCRRLLLEYAIDAGQDQTRQLVDDAEVLRPCLREIQRRDWRQEHGSLLDEVLGISGYDRQGANKWEQRVIELAQRLQPGCGGRLLPDALPDWPRQLASLRAKLLDLLPRLPEILDAAPRHEIIDRVRYWLGDEETKAKPLQAFHRLLEQAEKRRGFPENGFRLPALDEFYRSADWAGFRSQLSVHTVPLLQRALADFKRQHGQWSFRDMLAHVDDALDPDRNPRAQELAATLRRRFRCGIVDEFQDTDPVQWRILQRIFVDTSQPSPLFLVGDPKQAIFGFRGADLQTYLSATSTLLTGHGAQDYPLTVNWRSTPELLESLNTFFQDGAWFPEGSGIRYLPVHAAAEEDRPNRIDRDCTGRSALNIVDCRRENTLRELRRDFARFIVREIGRLLEPTENGPTLVSLRRGPARPLHAGDICVLVTRRSEARPLLGCLREAGVPFSFYRLPGLWQSEEAKHLRYVLEALSQPDQRGAFRKALLTRFFRIASVDLARNEDVPPRHPARQLFDDWVELADRRQWTSLFQSLLEDTGIFFDGLDLSDAERIRANLRHLTAQIVQQAYRQNLDLLGLVDWCRQQEKLGRSDVNVQPRETEQPRVQIMTIHASKGLEFPIVFLAGGWTRAGTDSLLSYRGAEGTVFDLTEPPSEQARKAAADEDRDEERRQFYVALTRAMFKLYVPHTLAQFSKFKFEGPLVDLLAPALDKANLANLPPGCAEVLELGRRVTEKGRGEREKGREEGGETGTASSVAGSAWDRTAREALPLVGAETTTGDDSAGRACQAVRSQAEPGTEEESSPPSPVPPSHSSPLFPVLDADLSRRGIVIRSFTSMHRSTWHQESDQNSNFAVEPGRAEDDDIDVPLETEEKRDPLQGAVFGEIVHGVLEQIDYEEVARAAGPEALLQTGAASERIIAEVIDEHLSGLSADLPEAELRVVCRSRVAELSWRALHTPLAELGLPLCQVAKKDRLHELQFHFPVEENRSAEPRQDEAFVTGFIDLIVRQRGRYFIVDWKTNRLPGYGPAELQAAMNENDYHLQYRLYVQALGRWLRRSLGPGFVWRRDFGGVYYLFLRGMTGGAEREGVFFNRP